MLPRNPLLQIFVSVVIALCLLCGASCASKRKSAMTKQDVVAFLEGLDVTAKRKDVAGIIEHFSKDARIKVNIEDEDAIIRGMVFTREQYRDYAEEAFAHVDEYQYDRTDTTITINPDGQSAILADQVFETVIAGGDTVKAVTVETATLKLEDGRVVLASLEGTTRWIR